MSDHSTPRCANRESQSAQNRAARRPGLSAWRVLALLSAAAILAGARPAAAGYIFTEVANSRNGFSDFGALPSINALGSVAFTASLNSGVSGLYLGGGGSPLNAAPGIGNPSLGGAPAINSGGAVAFEAGLSPAGAGIFVASGGTSTLIASNVGSQFGGFATPSLNNGGALSFVAGVGGGQAVVRAQAGTFTTIADSSGAFGGFVNNRTSINSAGDVAFYATLKAGGSGVFVGSGGALTTIADTSGALGGFLEGPLLNDSGSVAFLASLKSGGQAAYLSAGGSLLTVADTAGDYSQLLSLSLNNAGDVAFSAWRTSGGQGIFTGADSVADKVIAAGDALGGSTLQNITSRIAMNDAGQIVFAAQLADGTEGIYRADVVGAAVVPEPASALLAAVGALGLAGGRLIGRPAGGNSSQATRSKPNRPTIVATKERSGPPPGTFDGTLSVKR